MSLLDWLRHHVWPNHEPDTPSPGDIRQQAQREQSEQRVAGILSTADDAQQIARSAKRSALQLVAERGETLRQAVDEALERMDRRRA